MTLTKEDRKLLRTCRTQLRDLHMGWPEAELVEPLLETIRTITARLGDGYSVTTGEVESTPASQRSGQTREVEVLRVWSGSGLGTGTWDTETYDIPWETPEDKVQAAVERVVADTLDDEARADLVMVAVYHLPEPEEVEADES